jgi:hypothetical protein
MAALVLADLAMIQESIEASSSSYPFFPSPVPFSKRK